MNGSPEEVTEADLDLSDALLVLGFGVFVCTIDGEVADDNGDVEVATMEAVILAFDSEDEAGRKVEAKVVLPLESWEELSSLVVRAILDFETGGASEV